VNLSGGGQFRAKVSNDMNQSTLSVVPESVMPLLITSLKPREFALFPSETGGGVKITNEEMLQLSGFYSKLYIVYISRMSDHLVRQFEIKESAASLLARRALVPLIHCFMDRLVRVKKAIDSASGQLSTPLQELFPATNTIEAFEECAVANPAFNQFMVWFVGRIWQMPLSDPVPVSQVFTAQAGFKNNLFLLYSRSPWIFLKKIGLRLLARLPRSRLPALTMANATGAFFQNGFYSQYLTEVKIPWSSDQRRADRKLRKELFTNEFIENLELNKFLVNIGLGEEEIDRTKNIFKEFLQLYYPASLLEAVPESMQQAIQALQLFKKSVLIGSSGQGSHDSYISAAAKQQGRSIIGLQHGGHYGYIKDLSSILELEYPDMDEFVSWGWSQLPDHPALNGIAVNDLPSPWLSERRRYWADLDLGGVKEFDFLLMSNLVKRFPAAPQGASLSRIDLIQGFAASLTHLVRETTGHGLTILHKPYNPTTIKLLTKTMEGLVLIGGEQYHCIQQLDKGLTYELLQQCSVVLWDQPGTGFLECISSNIPTMVYWTRSSSQEEGWAKTIFHELEQQGIIHRDTDSLIEEMLEFKNSPLLWMANPERVSVINRFCRQYAWASDEWPLYWRRYFDELSRRNDSNINN
jgi:hypothetical protein